MTVISQKERPSVVVGLSGGVDSAVTAALLAERGYDVHGVFLCMTRAGGRVASGPRSCCSPDDARDAHRIAEQLGIRLSVESVSRAMEPIVDAFAETYRAGRTPNPCPACNATVKFPVLARVADRLGATYVATGHYARTVRDDSGEVSLLRAACIAKDQSYVLYAIGRNLLSRLLLPLGELPDKAAVRAEAERFGLEVADKPDSQDICFVPDGGYPELLRQYGEEGLQPGPIMDAEGCERGRHAGYARYTVGQRRGLGLAAGHPVYVTAIDPAGNVVEIGTRDRLQVHSLRARHVSWLCPPPSARIAAEVQVRYGSRSVPGTVLIEDGDSCFRVEFREPLGNAVPGQVAVVYDGLRVCGGGIIDSVERVARQPAGGVSGND